MFAVTTTRPAPKDCARTPLEFIIIVRARRVRLGGGGNFATHQANGLLLRQRLCNGGTRSILYTVPGRSLCGEKSSRQINDSRATRADDGTRSFVRGTE